MNMSETVDVFFSFSSLFSFRVHSCKQMILFHANFFFNTTFFFFFFVFTTSFLSVSATGIHSCFLALLLPSLVLLLDDDHHVGRQSTRSLEEGGHLSQGLPPPVHEHLPRPLPCHLEILQGWIEHFR